MIKDLKELSKLLKLCRSQGINEINLGDIHIKFGDLPVDKTMVAQEQGEGENQMSEDDLDRLVGMPQNPTDEELMDWSLGMRPNQGEVNETQ